MANVRKKIDVSKELTPAQVKMLKDAEKLEYVYDEDAPPLTKEELSQFKRVSDLVKHERRESRKQNVTLRLSPNAIKKAKALGKGYTSILAKIIEKALDNPALTEQLIK